MKAARADNQLIWTVAMAFITFFMAIYGSGCTPKQPPVQEPPSLSQRLDMLYVSDRGAWRAEMERLLNGSGVAIPPKHLAYAIDAFNDQTTRAVCMEAASRYLKARTATNGRMATEVDSELLKAYAEMALTSADSKTAQGLRDICARADREPVCRGRF